MYDPLCDVDETLVECFVLKRERKTCMKVHLMLGATDLHAPLPLYP